MAERLRGIEIQVEVDTNKATDRRAFELREGESTAELLARVRAWLDDRLEDLS